MSRGLARAARTVRRRAPRLRRRGFTLTDRATIVVAALAGATLVAALAVELGRMWRHPRMVQPGERDAQALLGQAEEVVGEAVEAVVQGYRAGSWRENAVFNLLVSFVGALALARGIAYGLRSRRAVGPFRSLRLGRRHIHHFVPGILLAFVAGATAIVTRSEDVQRFVAIPFGIGMGMTFDESALLLELEDVYWSEEGIVGMRIALGVAAMLGALAIGLRFTRRGELIVLGPDGLAAPGAARAGG